MQDVALFVLSDAGSLAGPGAFVLRGLVLLVANGLALGARVEVECIAAVPQ